MGNESRKRSFFRNENFNAIVNAKKRENERTRVDRDVATLSTNIDTRWSRGRRSADGEKAGVEFNGREEAR